MASKIVLLCITLAAGISARNLLKIQHRHDKSLSDGTSKLDTCTDPDGVFLPVPGRCADYSLCLEGVLIYFTCGGNNYFNALLGYCEEDKDYVCVPRRPCSSVPTGNVIPIEGECYKYQLCIEGEPIPLECKFGQLFSAELGFCILDLDGVCWDYSTTTTEEPTTTTTEEPTGSTTEEPIGSTTEEEPAATMTTEESTEEPTTTMTTEEVTGSTTTEEPIGSTTEEEPAATTTIEEPTTTTEEPTGFTTTEEPIGSTTEEPTGSTTTEEPTGSTTTEEPTGSTTTEEPIGSTTEEEPAATMTTEEPTGEPLTTTTTEERTSTTTTEETTETNVCEGISIGFVPHQDCNKFYTCMDGEATVSTCPGGNYFDRATKRCETDTDGVCLGRCSALASGTRFPDENDCHSYFECQSGDEYALECPSGYYFDAATSQCLDDVDNTCGTASPTTCNGQTDGTIVPHGACGSYFVCNKNEAEVKSCDNGYRFDVQELKCISDPQFTCFCELNAEAVFPSDNCHEYYKCEQGEGTTQNCPQGEYFEIMSLGCVADQNEQCLTSTTTAAP